MLLIIVVVDVSANINFAPSQQIQRSDPGFSSWARWDGVSFSPSRRNIATCDNDIYIVWDGWARSSPVSGSGWASAWFDSGVYLAKSSDGGQTFPVSDIRTIDYDQRNFAFGGLSIVTKKTDSVCNIYVVWGDSGVFQGSCRLKFKFMPPCFL